MDKPPKPLTVPQERFVLAYVAGPDDLRGNGTRSYLHAFPNATNEKNARSSASRLLARDSVRARVRALRDEAAAEAKARLLSWVEEAPQAQEVLLQAMAGEWPKDWSDEAIRQAVKAAQHWLDRALGSVQQMHNVDVAGTGVQVIVAAGVVTHEKPSPTNVDEQNEGGRVVALS